jgi:hypothetical protein
MASTPRPMYLGFTVTKRARLYKLRVEGIDGEVNDFTLAIPNRAFLEQRVRYQDAPEICFAKLERALNACEDASPASHLKVSNDDLDVYREAHTKSVPRRHWPFVKS